MLQQRRNIIRNYTFQTVNYAIRYCLKNEIGNIVIGELPDIKRNIQLGKKNYQHFQAIPIGNFKQQLETKCNLYGIQYLEVKEVYTSQTCSKCGIVRKANRVHRGLYKCNQGQCKLTINADVNGALNISKKVAPNVYQYHLQQLDKRSSGLVNRPKRIRPNFFQSEIKRDTVNFAEATSFRLG